MSTHSPSDDNNTERGSSSVVGRVLNLITGGGLLLVFGLLFAAQLPGGWSIRGWPLWHLIVVLPGLLFSVGAVVWAVVNRLARQEYWGLGNSYGAATRNVLLGWAALTLVAVGVLYGAAHLWDLGRQWGQDRQQRAAAQSFIALEECTANLQRLGDEVPRSNVAGDASPPLITPVDEARFVLSTQEYVTSAVCVTKNLREAMVLTFEGRDRMRDDAARELEPGRNASQHCKRRVPELSAAEGALWEQERQWNAVERLLVSGGDLDSQGFANLDAAAVFQAITERPVLPERSDNRPFWGATADADGGRPWVTVNPDVPYVLTVAEPTLEQVRAYCAHSPDPTSTVSTDTNR